MSQPKILTDEELLKLLEVAEDIPQTVDLNVLIHEKNPDLETIVEFVNRFNLKAGSNGIRVRALFHIYKLYYQNDFTYNKFRYILTVVMSDAKFASGRVYIDMNMSLIPKEAIIQASFIKPKARKVVQSSKKLDEYLKFIKRFNIKEGKRLISLSYLYKVYCIAVPTGNQQYSMEDFMNILCKSFKNRWMKGYKYFYLNVPKEGLLCQEEVKKNTEN